MSGTGARSQARVGPSGSPARPLVWVFHMALPMVGLCVLIRQPTLDATWFYEGTHFVLVSLGALASVAVGYLVNESARRRADVRLFLVGLVFLLSSGFLFMHALATPGVMLAGSTAGFELGVPVGLAISSVFAAMSAVELSPRTASALLDNARWIRVTLLVVLIAWGADALMRLPPLDGRPGSFNGPRIGLAVVGVPLYLFAALRYFRMYRRRDSVVLLSVLTAFLLLAEALLAVPIGHVWHLSWWLWHLLMVFGFGYVAYSAQVQYRHAGTAVGLFDGVGARATVARLRDDHGAALEALVRVMQRREQADEEGLDREVGLASAGLGSRFGLSDGQTAVLGRAAEALAGERAQLARLGALVGIGRQASVIRPEQELLEAALQRITEGFPDHGVRIGLLVEGLLIFPAGLSTESSPAPDAASERAARAGETVEDGAGGSLALPLSVKGRPCGVLQVRRDRGRFDRRDRAMLESLAAQLSMVLENARLYRQLDGLFRSYMSPDVATALLADPARAELGGALIEVTALFADLRGFTTFSERVSPHEIVELLNRYFEAATAAVLAEGGTIVQFVGDAMMALFNAPVQQPDHPVRAARAALAIQAAIETLAGADPDAPRFRVGVNTGEALVGNIGSERLRNFNAMGDAVNVAARLQTVADPGSVVIGADTRSGLPPDAGLSPLGSLTLKGRTAPVAAYVLHDLG